MAPVFITGGTGCMGRRLIKKLVAQGCDVTAVVRKGSEHKLPPGVRAIIADPLQAKTFQRWIQPGCVFVQLLGLSKPSSKEEEQLRSVDLQSVRASAEAAVASHVSHFVYVSVAMTDSKMRASFREVRREGEACLLATKIPCTIVRPWYILGPAQWWRSALLPLYGLARFKREWQRKAAAHRLVYIGDMIQTLVNSVQTPVNKTRFVEIPQIVKHGLQRSAA